MRSKFLMGLVPAFVALMALCSVPARATVLLSLSVVVGDANWTVGTPLYKGTQSPELHLNLSQFAQPFGGPGGLIRITYYGPAIVESDEYYSNFIEYDFYRCASHCTTFGDLLGPAGGDEADTGGLNALFQGSTDFSLTIDQTLIARPRHPSPDLPIGSVPGLVDGFPNYSYIYEQGTLYSVLNTFVSPDAIGQAYSLIIDDGIGDVPEPGTWALMLFGFGSAGATMRTRRRKCFAGARTAMF
ncbi:MAG TPA: PEPxxWA-CTERM sorting domain-containing protein [Rhizomicrobium sp.]|nr:PEPxxWA-CTERM sorting domain-containing protein [Rhizomicrobium sp.]